MRPRFVVISLVNTTRILIVAHFCIGTKSNQNFIFILHIANDLLFQDEGTSRPFKKPWHGIHFGSVFDTFIIA